MFLVLHGLLLLVGETDSFQRWCFIVSPFFPRRFFFFFSSLRFGRTVYVPRAQPNRVQPHVLGAVLVEPLHLLRVHGDRRALPAPPAGVDVLDHQEGGGHRGRWQKAQASRAGGDRRVEGRLGEPSEKFSGKNYRSSASGKKVLLARSGGTDDGKKRRGDGKG